MLYTCRFPPRAEVHPNPFYTAGTEVSSVTLGSTKDWKSEPADYLAGLVWI